jgi:hypothetical protein
MTTSDYLINAPFVSLVFRQAYERRLDARSALLPLVIVFVVARQYVHSIPTAGNDLVLISAPLDAPILGVALSPDGRSLGMVRGGMANDVVVVDLAARRLRFRRVLPVNGVRELSWSPDGHWLLVTLSPGPGCCSSSPAGTPCVRSWRVSVRRSIDRLAGTIMGTLGLRLLVSGRHV